MTCPADLALSHHLVIMSSAYAEKGSNMSAFLCNDEHTSIVADLVVMLDAADGHNRHEVFAELRMQNLLSLAARYPQNADYYLMLNVVGYKDHYFRSYRDATMLMLSYRYQSCEHDNWEYTLAKQWTDTAAERMADLWDIEVSQLVERAHDGGEARWSCDVLEG